jgi:hypothetical protein
MNTAESKSIVRSAAEEEGEFLVSFFNHDGYFTVPPSAQAAELRKKILSAKDSKKEISFVYDRDLKILKVL